MLMKERHKWRDWHDDKRVIILCPTQQLGNPSQHEAPVQSSSRAMRKRFCPQRVVGRPAASGPASSKSFDLYGVESALNRSGVEHNE